MSMVDCGQGCPVCGAGHIVDEGTRSLGDEMDEAAVKHILGLLEKRVRTRTSGILGDLHLFESALAALKRERSLYRECFNRFTIEGDFTETNPVLAALERLEAAAVKFQRERDVALELESEFSSALYEAGKHKLIVDELLVEIETILLRDRSASSQFLERLRTAVAWRPSGPSNPNPVGMPPSSPKTSSRPSFEKIHIELARLISMRSTCTRLKVGCVIASTDFRKVLAVGYNGNASGLPNGCDSEEPGKCGCLHAEENAIINCDAPRSTSKIVFCTDLPCKMCAKRLVNLGHVEQVIYARDYRLKEGIDVLSAAGIPCVKYEGEF